MLDQLLMTTDDISRMSHVYTHATHEVNDNPGLHININMLRPLATAVAEKLRGNAWKDVDPVVSCAVPTDSAINSMTKGILSSAVLAAHVL